MGEKIAKNFSERGEILRSDFTPTPLTPEQEGAKRKLDAEQQKLEEIQDAEPEVAPLTEKEEDESARKRRAIWEKLGK